MITLQGLFLSFFAGILGCLIGGLETFMCTGVIGLFVLILSASHVDTTFLNDVFLNTLFLPCILFNGAGFATAYASKHHNIQGYEVTKSLAFTNDAKVLLVGSIGSIAGYFLYVFANICKLPMDAGAFSVLVLSIVGRFLFTNTQRINKENIRLLKHKDFNYWFFHVLVGTAVSAVTVFFVKETGLYDAPFSICAITLLFILFNPDFPATHHVALIASQAFLYSQNIVLSILMGVCAYFVGILWAQIGNDHCGNHIDPPAVSIGVMSLFLCLIF